MAEFSISSAKQIIKSQGDKRVSEDAADQLRQILEGFEEELSEEAIALSEEDGLKTVRAEHIERAQN